MRILQINVLCGTGSTGRIATDIHVELKNNDHVSMIAFGRGEAKNCDNAYRISQPIDHYVDVLKTRLFDKHSTSAKQATRALCATLDTFEPDIVHLHNIHGYYLNVELLMKQLKLRRIPVIWTLHDCWSFTGHCAYFDSPKCDRWHTGCGSCPRLHDYPESWLMDRSAKNLSEKKSWFSNFPNLTLVTPSRWLKDLASQSYLSHYPIQVIPNGIDLTNFKHTDSDLRIKHNIVDKRVYLSVAMVWDRRKGLDDIVRFAETLTIDEALIVIGLTPKQIEQLPNTMIKIARTSSVKELAEYYSLADVTVVPSYEDNYPTVVLESLACGTPVVAYATGGIPEMEQSPYLTTVEKGDLDALGACLRTRTKIQSWSVDVSRFDKTQSAKAMVALYQSVLLKKGD